MPLMQMLDLSTANMTSKDAKLLENYDAGKPLIVYPFDCGWTISTSGLLNGAEDRAELLAAVRREGFSEHFINVLTHAADLGAVMIRFDRDAEFEPGLPAFNWENNDEITPNSAPQP